MEEQKIQIETTTLEGRANSDHFSDVGKMIDWKNSVSRIRDVLCLELKKFEVNIIFDFGCAVCVAKPFKGLGYGT